MDWSILIQHVHTLLSNYQTQTDQNRLESYFPAEVARSSYFQNYYLADPDYKRSDHTYFSRIPTLCYASSRRHSWTLLPLTQGQHIQIQENSSYSYLTYFLSLYLTSTAPASFNKDSISVWSVFSRASIAIIKRSSEALTSITRGARPGNK